MEISAEKKFRTEHDTMGEVRVPADKYWGAQTERSRQNFKIGRRKMPDEIIRAFAYMKKAAAAVNCRLGKLDRERAELISESCDAILAGKLRGNFPLVIYQTGSGTQTNMNVNEVIANYGNMILRQRNAAKIQGTAETQSSGTSEMPDFARETENLTGAEVNEDGLSADLCGGKLHPIYEAAAPRQSSADSYGGTLHPNDHVNMSQSSNDTFPTAMHIAALTSVTRRVIPETEALRDSLSVLEKEYADVVKTGRTHLQDATPLTLGQEISGWRSMLDHDRDQIAQAAESLREIALGGTAVGTGLNAPDGFAEAVAEEISALTGIGFRTAPNKFHSLTSKDALVYVHGALKALAADLMKIANDVRLLASGPRSGIGEIFIPENEPGSSIMPGKVNPTQCEAVTMVSVQVMGNDVAIGIAASQGNFQLNVFMPVLIDDFLESCELLSDVMASFRKNCVDGIRPNLPRIRENMERSLMLVTALSPHIGYENSARIAKKAHADGTTLKEAATALGLVTGEEFDAWVVPEKMARPDANS